MVWRGGFGHDGGMDDPQETPRATSDAFDPHRLRSITDIKRSKDDRLLGGVCAGAATYLNIDPVIVRVIIAVLTLVGGAGVILYAAAWFLLPAEDAATSVAADWFKLDKNEQQIRVGGLVVAGALAALTLITTGGDAWWGIGWILIGWILIPLAALYYIFAVRPHRQDPEAAAFREDIATRAHAPGAATGAATGVAAHDTAPAAVNAAAPVWPQPRPKRSRALTLLTISLAAIAVAVTRIYADFNGGAPFTTYLAVALGVTAMGLLVGTFFGHGGPLIALGILLAAALAVGSLIPSPKIGAQQLVPTTAAQVNPAYEHGIGLLELDLTEAPDLTSLLGRTIDLDAGIGQTKVIIPEGLNVIVNAQLSAGEISVFGRTANGTDNTLAYPAESGAPALTIDIHQKLGNVEVVRS